MGEIAHFAGGFARLDFGQGNVFAVITDAVYRGPAIGQYVEVVAHGILIDKALSLRNADFVDQIGYAFQFACGGIGENIAGAEAVQALAAHGRVKIVFIDLPAFEKYLANAFGYAVGCQAALFFQSIIQDGLTYGKVLAQTLGGFGMAVRHVRPLL